MTEVKAITYEAGITVKVQRGHTRTTFLNDQERHTNKKMNAAADEDKLAAFN